MINHMQHIYKYPRTYHLAGSGIQRGDEDLAVVPLRVLEKRHVVVEEKMDGANCAISCDEDGRLLLQSRGHYLTGGPREKQFHLFKSWAQRYTGEFSQALGDRYILYGEWLYAKHTTFYTDLPHYFMEFDIFDKVEQVFLSTELRQIFLDALPFVSSVKVLHEGAIESEQALLGLLGPSYFISNPQDKLRVVCQEKSLNFEQVLKETDTSGLMEGLYIKIEEEDIVQERYKYVRGGFLQAVFDSESHWLDRPILPNSLKPGVTLF
jgi:hypothetical protein